MSTNTNAFNSSSWPVLRGSTDADLRDYKQSLHKAGLPFEQPERLELLGGGKAAISSTVRNLEMAQLKYLGILGSFSPPVPQGLYLD